MTLMILAILSLESLISRIDSIISCIWALPLLAESLACSDSWAACLVLDVLCDIMEADSCKVDEVSSMAAACSVLPWDNCCAEADNWLEAAATCPAPSPIRVAIEFIGPVILRVII